MVGVLKQGLGVGCITHGCRAIRCSARQLQDCQELTRLQPANSAHQRWTQWCRRPIGSWPRKLSGRGQLPKMRGRQLSASAPSSYRMGSTSDSTSGASWSTTCRALTNRHRTRKKAMSPAASPPSLGGASMERGNMTYTWYVYVCTWLLNGDTHQHLRI
jgi:hypothetical protein